MTTPDTKTLVERLRTHDRNYSPVPVMRQAADRLEAQEKRIAELEEENATLKNQINALHKDFERMANQIDDSPFGDPRSA